MKTSFAALILTFGSAGLSAPTQTSCNTEPPMPVCKELMLPIKAAANNTDLPPYPDSTDPGVFYKYLNFNASSLPQIPVSGTFKISVLYCQPLVKVQGREGTVQVLLHGLTATKEYWNGMNFPHSAFRGQYSWIYHAASQGYATLAIDNLGNGRSDRPDPIRIVQTPLQLSVIYGILTGLRAGSLPDIPKYSKIILGTHSYGSVLGRLIATVFPTSGADAYILTATSKNLTGLRQFIANIQARAASAVDPRFKDLAPAYLSATKNIREVVYGLDGSFDPKMAKWDANYPHVFAAGEVANSREALPSSFSGPVMIITGRQDQVACGNGTIVGPVPDCGIGPGTRVDETKTFFPKAKVFNAYVPEDTAHNINTHYSAPESFGAAHLWLESVGF